MKTIRVSDHAHQSLLRLLGKKMAQTGKTVTLDEVIEALVSTCVVLPSELIRHVDEFIQNHEQLGYTTTEEFIRDAVVQSSLDFQDHKKSARSRKEKYEVHSFS